MKNRLRVGCALVLALAIHGASSVDAAEPDPPASHAAPSTSVDSLVASALRSNRELAAARLDLDRARARLSQASLIPNPSLELSQTGGGLGRSPGELERSAKLSLPIEYGGKRGRRVDVAETELLAAEVELADRERLLAAQVRTLYAEAVALSSELAFTGELVSIDAELARMLQARVGEGDAAPLEWSLFRIETERLGARRAILEGRLRSAELRLKTVAGLAPTDSISLSDDASHLGTVLEVDTAVAHALDHRPDLKRATLEVVAAEAGVRLESARALPDVTLFGGYGEIESSFDTTPIGPLTDRDELFNAGVEVSIPLFDRNQGARAEARAVVEQAKRRREQKELEIRAEVEAALARFRAAQAAVSAFETGVVEGTAANVRTARAAYEAGAFTISEFLAERRRLVDARRELIEALTERTFAAIDVHSAIAEPVVTTEEPN